MRMLAYYYSGCSLIVMETVESKEPIAVRLARLNQLITGRSSLILEQKSLLNHDGLLDSLLVLYDECSSEYLARNQYAASFVKKCEFLKLCLLIFLNACVIDRGGNGYPLLCYYLGRKILKWYPWKHGRNVYVPAGALQS